MFEEYAEVMFAPGRGGLLQEPLQDPARLASPALQGERARAKKRQVRVLAPRGLAAEEIDRRIPVPGEEEKMEEPLDRPERARCVEARFPQGGLGLLPLPCAKQTEALGEPLLRV
jgi:hypothetical protein